MNKGDMLSYIFIAVLITGLAYVGYRNEPPHLTRMAFTWIDGRIDYQMAYSVYEAGFTDVVVRRVTVAEMTESVSNLHAVGLRAWQWVQSPAKSLDFESYFSDAKNTYAPAELDGFYVDDFQILAESGGDINDYNSLVQQVDRILGPEVVVCAVSGFNSKLSDGEIMKIKGLKDFDYYAAIDFDYANSVFPETETRGIYAWLFDIAGNVSLDKVERIYKQAVDYKMTRVTVWQWYFAGEDGHKAEDSSVMFRPDLVEHVAALNKRFLSQNY